MDLDYDHCGVCEADIDKGFDVYSCALCWRLICATGCVRKLCPSTLYAVCVKCEAVERALESLCKRYRIPLNIERHIADFGPTAG